MVRKHSVLLGITLAIAFLLISTAFYPGGSQHDANAPGFNWQHNYLSNLLNPIAVNKLDNPAYPWAVAGILFLCIAVAVFFVRFSKKIPLKSAANVIKYAGAGGMIFAVLAATPWHDLAVMVSGTLLLLSLFYITVFTFKSGLHLLKAFSVVCLLVLYGCSFVYYTSTHLEWLPILQKTSLVMNLIWILALEYATESEDFQR